MNAISNYFSRIILKKRSFLFGLTKDFEPDFEEERKRHLILFLLSLLVLVVVPLSLRNLFQGIYLKGFVPILITLGIIGLHIDQRKKRVKEINFNLTLVLLMFMILYTIFVGAYHGSHSQSLYLFALPPVVFFLTGTRKGIKWCALFLFTTLLMMTGVNLFFGNPIYTGDYIERFSIIYIILCAMLCVFEIIRQKSYQQWLDEKDQFQSEINRRKEVEQALKQSQSYADDLINATLDIAFLINADGTILEMNRIAVEIYNTMGFKNLIGRSFYDILPSGRVKGTKNRHAQIIKEGQPFRTKVRYGKYYFDTITSPIKDQESKTTNLAIFFRDISKEQIAEDALRENEERYRTILDSIEEGYFEVNLAGNFTFINDALSNNTGFTKEELIGKNNRDYMPPETAKIIFNLFSEIYKTGKPVKKVSYQVLKKDGSPAFHELSASLMKNHKGEPIGFRGIARDVTDLKVAEESRQRLEAQLIYAQKMESIGTLAGGIAHNFNNLLMGIQGNVSLTLMDMDQKETYFKNLKNIEKLIQNGSKLTEQLLGYARGGKYEVKPINLNRIVNDIAETFGQARKEILIHQDLSDELRGVNADQGQIEQVILNLFVNATEAMPGGGELFINTLNVTAEHMKGKPYAPRQNDYVLMTIRDTGIGMDKETIERIFEPFFTTKGLANGTGLGLASVYGIIKAHNGFIDVESKQGQGTIFSLYLPSTDRPIEKTAKIPKDDFESGTETILLVDDEEVILETGAHMLEKIGYKVLKASSGQEALSVYEKASDIIDMVLLDIIMPGMGGGETFDHLKEINKEVKVLLSSGYTIDDQAAEIIKKGCKSFIQKPFDINTLSRSVREVLNAA